jgi:hypothetical protein
MSFKVLLSAGFVFHTIIGNFCMMMPMAYAMESIATENAVEEMEQVTEMVMTPVTPMTSLDCDGCVTIMRPRFHMPTMGGGSMPCNDGHCLSWHTPSIATITHSPQNDPVQAAILPVSFSYAHTMSTSIYDEWNTSPRIQISFVRSIVLRE